MKIISAAATALAILATPAASAATHSAKYSAVVHSELPGCVFFQLEGVAVADSAVSTSPWFALATNHPNFSTLNAILLSANLTRRTISVSTSGSPVCGGPAGVTAIVLD